VRLLVVDDDEVFREELSTFLGDEGHQVESAPSARKALEVLETGERDIVFTDLKMPRQSGLDLLREIRQRWPRTYVIVVTGFATVPTAVEAMKLGAFEYIGKPFRGEQVRQVLRLVTEERAFSEADLPNEEPIALATSLAKTHKLPMLLLTDRPGKATDGVTVRPYDGADPARLLDEVEAFYGEHEKGGVVLARIDRLLVDHRLEDIVDLLRRVRDKVQTRGPFAIGLDPHRVSRDAATAVRSVLVAQQVHGTLEAIASPIRRRVLLRLAQAPAGFSDVMHAAELDDSPKLSFHMHRLVDEGLVAHSGERYRLTPKGEGAVTLLHDMERLASGSTAGAILFESKA
jgi:ActR/RegA family two-component response regulator